MSDPLKVGVVGVGYLGKFHAKIYAGMADVELVGVVDSDAEAANSIAEQYRCDAFDSPEQLIGKVDAVNIVVPTSLHRQIAEPFIRAGVHIMMEKPIASTVEDSQYLVELAQKYGVTLQVGHLERFNAGMQRLAEQVSCPRYIDAQRLGVFTPRATDVDVVTDLMIHDIDIVLSLVPSELVGVDATGTTVVTDHIDIANARLTYEDGTVANITASRVSRQGARRIRVFESDRYLSLDFQTQQVEVVKAGDQTGDHGFPELEAEHLEIAPCMPLDAELADFVRCLREQTTPLVTGEKGLRALQVAEQVKAQINQRR